MLIHPGAFDLMTANLTLSICISLAALSMVPVPSKADESREIAGKRATASLTTSSKSTSTAASGKSIVSELQDEHNEHSPGRLRPSEKEARLDVPTSREERKLEPARVTHLQGGVRHTSVLARVRRHKLSAEDFRKMEYGVLGLVAVNRMLFPGLPVVAEVFPSCPAAVAGIRPGDVLISEDGYKYHPGAGQKEIWATLGGKAGTRVALTVRRRHKLITFNLVRMNIEDIQNNRVRQMFESILSHYGPPGSSRADAAEPGNPGDATEPDDSGEAEGVGQDY